MKRIKSKVPPPGTVPSANAVSASRRALVRVGLDSEDMHGWKNLYSVPPTHEITVEQLETVAVRRLRMLRELEMLRMKGKAVETDVRAVIKKYAMDDLADDNLSHFLLRLVYCRNEALRRWFISQEVALFRYRISLLQPVEKETMLKFNDLPGVKMTSAEKEQFKPQLSALVYGDRDFDALEFYKVHFTQVLDLVATRKVVLHRGTAFVERDLLVSILITKFRQLLSESLLVAFKARPFINEIEADRLMPFLNTLSERYLASNQEWDGSTAADKILPSQLDFLAARSFPLCMRGLHFQLRSVHHLKYGGRMQYGLFLKGIGLSLEHALEFWRSEFALSQGVDKFDKNYAYNIRHNYGQEGRRVDYTPYSCKKIIMGTAPGHMDYHGCPFRHQDSDKLKQTLQGYGADEKLVAEVVDAARAQHYEIACQKYFDATHPGYVSEVPHSHPNKYFKESMKYFATKEAEKQGAVSSSADKQENKRMSLD